MKNNSLKINNGCLNIFKLLVLLYDDEAEYKKVIEIFKNDISVEENYDEKKLNNLYQVILNKYINALKVFGVKVYKKKNKFKLDSSLYSINYSIQDLKAMSIIIGASNKLQDVDIVKDISDLKTNLLLRMNNKDKNILNMYSGDNDFSFFYTDFKQQIDKCKFYTKEGSLLDIVYLYRNKERRCKCQAKEVFYDVKTAYLKVYDTQKNEYIDIPIPNILSITLLPNRINSFISTKTVVYKLKGRLANTYKLKANEKLDSKTENEMIIINRNEPLDKLFSRLMRYADLCEIITPKSLRREMLNLLDDTLDLYKK